MALLFGVHVAKFPVIALIAVYFEKHVYIRERPFFSMPGKETGNSRAVDFVPGKRYNVERNS
ncbi:MAG: hypothetical protein EGQ26_02695 [Clostridiales bacterium]|nr:hypothetical protein [Clostridiales bacterium]